MKYPLIYILCPLLTFDSSCPQVHNGLLFTKINFFPYKNEHNKPS